MKKLMLLSITLFALAQLLNAQSQRPKKNYLDLNAGMGMLPTFVKDAGKVKTPPLSLTADYQVVEHFSIGAYAGLSVTETDARALRDGSTAQWSNRFSIFGLRLAARSSQMGPWNVYGGLSAGYSISKIDMMQGDIEKVKSEKNIRAVSGKMLMTGFLGGRYSLTPKAGIFGELGYGVSLATVGLSIRI